MTNNYTNVYVKNRRKLKKKTYCLSSCVCRTFSFSPKCSLRNKSSKWTQRRRQTQMQTCCIPVIISQWCSVQFSVSYPALVLFIYARRSTIWNRYDTTRSTIGFTRLELYRYLMLFVERSSYLLAIEDHILSVIEVLTQSRFY